MFKRKYVGRLHVEHFVARGGRTYLITVLCMHKYVLLRVGVLRIFLVENRSPRVVSQC